MKNNKTFLYILLFLILSFIWVNSMLSKETSKALSDFVLSILFSTERTGNTGEGFPIRKLAHFMEFAALGADLFLIFITENKTKPFLKALIFSGICAGMDETIQIFSQRGNSIFDVMLDTFGAASGIFIVYYLIRLYNNYPPA